MNARHAGYEILKAILWDLDGTLVDSENFHWRAWRRTMEAEGAFITQDDFRASFGQRNDSILPRWLGMNATPDRVQRVGDSKESYYRNLVRSEGLAPLPGAADWVRRLRSEGWKQAVASSAPRQNIEVVLEALKLSEYFEITVGAEDVHQGKPDPEIFLVAAERLGARTSRCVVVEDSSAGIHAAKRANIRNIAVGTLNTQLLADINVPTLVDLPLNAFEALLRRID
jgi:beta-phosphoglucomutase